MCLAPCYQGCTDERYAEEAAGVESFLATRGESRLVPLRAQREEASANLDFEQAAAAHAQVLKAETVQSLASELVRPLARLRAVIVQASAEPGEVALFLYASGRLRGPAAFSTLGMRIQNEQSGSTSLFAQPMALEPVAESRDRGTEGRREQEDREKVHGTSRPSNMDPSQGTPTRDKEAAKAARGMLELRLEAVLEELSEEGETPDATVRQGHLALLKRWYYRPEARRPGEIFFPGGDGALPLKAILRGVGRVAAKSVAAAPPA